MSESRELTTDEVRENLLRRIWTLVDPAYPVASTDHNIWGRGCLPPMPRHYILWHVESTG